ncbi:hypothetical protein BP6252_03907 [Coleophoma cylindrospora]|uniref:BTB domain-containing protein n=1 Tax=Coleophoma cylindrospora TaxID=1849047 RepID=A0A3D8S8V9_9HELO|nr:hypothetical protein BP6252_03907 [Coleophoma cylindrospora]
MASPGGNGSIQAVRIHKFEWPGLEPDLRLEVFDSDEFHVHSTVMKLHSAFFRKFLNSPNKTADQSVPVQQGTFKYTWITDVDEDGSWALISNTSQLISKDKTYRLVKDRTQEIVVFGKLLRAIYHQNYTVDSASELERLTRMADYYLAIPALSFSLYAVLPGSHGLIFDLRSCSSTIIETARKLQNTVLFKECMVYVMNPWDCPRYLDETQSGKPLKNWNPALQKAFGAATIDIYQKIARFYQRLMDIRIKGGFSDFEIDVLQKLREEHDREIDNFPLPIFLQKVRDVCCTAQAPYDISNLDEFIDNLDHLLSSQLSLSPSSKAGCGLFEEYLLCIKIEDEFLPWDKEQIDW